VKTIFGCSGTIFETQAGVASGYFFAFDVASNTVSAMLAMRQRSWSFKDQLVLSDIPFTGGFESHSPASFL